MLSRLANVKFFISHNCVLGLRSIVTTLGAGGKTVDEVKLSVDYSETRENRRKHLTKEEINSRFLNKYPELASIQYSKLLNNIRLMDDLGIDDEAVVKMLSQDQPMIWKCYKACKTDKKRYNYNRIQYISKLLKISQAELLSTLPKFKFIFTVSLARTIKIITVLLHHNVEPNDILSDFWVIRCKPERIELRLNTVQDAEIENLRPWMGRCRNSIFESFMNRASRKQKMLGELSLEEYISQRLGYSVSEIKEIIDREPQLQRASGLKIKKILDFLFSSGFTAEHILSGLPRVANRRIETINSRLQEMQQEGLPPSLYVLCKSKREYQHYMKKKREKNNC